MRNLRVLQAAALLLLCWGAVAAAAVSPSVSASLRAADRTLQDLNSAEAVQLLIQTRAEQAEGGLEDAIAVALLESRIALLADQALAAQKLAAEAAKLVGPATEARTQAAIQLAELEANLAARKFEGLLPRLEALQAFCKVQDLPAEGLRAQLLHAEWLTGNQQAAAARGLANQVLNVARARRDGPLVLLALWKRAESELAASQLVPAQRSFEQLLQQATQQKQVRMQFLARTRLSKVLIKRGQLPAALAMAKASLKLAYAHHDTLALAIGTSNVGNALRELSRLEPALPYLSDAATRYQALGLPIREADMRVDIGIIHRRRGAYAEALAQYEQARKVFEAANDWEGAGNAANNTGAVYEDLGRFEEAIAAFERSMAYRRQYGDRWNEGVAQSNIAAELMFLKRPAEALAPAEQSLLIAREVDDSVGVGLSLSIIAEIRLLLGDAAASLPLLEEALAALRASGDISLEESALRTKAQALLALGRKGEAESTVLQALRLSESIGEAESIWRGNDLLMQLRAAPGHNGEAIAYGKRAIRTIEGLRVGAAELGSESRRTLRADVRPGYERLAELLLLEQRFAEAEQMLQLLKQDEYQDYIENPQLQGGVQLSFSRTEAGWMRALDALFDQLRKADASAGVRAKLSARQRSLTQQLVQLRDRMARPDSAKPDFSDADAELLGASQRALQGSSTAILRSLLAGPRVHLLLTSASGYSYVQSPMPREALIASTLDYRRLLGSPDQDPLPLAQQLHRALIAPLTNTLQAQKITGLQIAPDGALRYLPYAALHDGQQWLAERYAVALQAGTPQAAEPAPLQTLQMAAFGRTAGSGTLGPLPNVALELHSLVQGEGGATPSQGLFQGLLLLDDRFTQQALFAALANPRYPLAHLATHFKISPSSEADSFLLLGDGSHLSLSDLRNAPLNLRHLRLFTLSACETAVDLPGADGREVEGLATAVLNKGSQAVLATLWPVEDGSTGIFMRSLYRQLKDGSSGALALQQSQLAFLQDRIPEAERGQLRGGLRGAGAESARAASYAGFRHPFYWAPFVWIDRGQQ